MLKEDEDYKAGVARMVENCEACEESYCEKHRRIISKWQDIHGFDVEGYVNND